MTTPSPLEGESPRDEQSETVSAPNPDADPPVRTRATPVAVWALWLLWAALGVALLVTAVWLLV